MTPLTRDEFYEKFPWVCDMPARPVCRECWEVSTWWVDEVEDAPGEWLLYLDERHLSTCPRAEFDGTRTLVSRQRL